MSKTVTVWKSKRVPLKPGVWVSEIRLKEVNAKRRAAVKKLLALLDKEGFDERIS